MNVVLCVRYMGEEYTKMQDTTYRTTTVEEIPSNVTIGKHPIHPMVIIFPIAALSGALITDVVYLLTNDDFWARSSVYLITAGVVTGAVAGALGALDYLTNPRIRSLRVATLHGAGNVVVIVLAVINLLVRVDDSAAGLRSPGIFLSVIIGLLMVATGWLGGELVYRHKVGVDSRGVDPSH
jgi:uncharacterized membrane protein